MWLVSFSGALFFWVFVVDLFCFVVVDDVCFKKRSHSHAGLELNPLASASQMLRL